MTPLVGIDIVKERLRIDFDSEDADVEALSAAASEMVMNYLKLDHDYYLDSSGEIEVDSSGYPVDVPAAVVTATLLLTGILYRDRDGKDWEKWEHGYLPTPVRSMLYPLRDPALA